MAPAALSTGDLFTYADYSHWPEGERWELIHGVAYNMTPAPSRRHQEILWRLSQWLGPFFKDKDCKPYFAPFDVRLPEAGQSEEETENVVQPDLVVYCDTQKLDDKGAVGPPDWVMEVLSPSTMKKDLVHKTLLYQQHGVPEYWMIDPMDQQVSVCQYQASLKQYSAKQNHGPEGTVSPALFPQLKIDLAALFAD